jgi:hypothetical protein
LLAPISNDLDCAGFVNLSGCSKLGLETQANVSNLAIRAQIKVCGRRDARRRWIEIEGMIAWEESGEPVLEKPAAGAARRLARFFWRALILGTYALIGRRAECLEQAGRMGPAARSLWGAPAAHCAARRTAPAVHRAARRTAPAAQRKINVFCFSPPRGAFGSLNREQKGRRGREERREEGKGEKRRREKEGRGGEKHHGLKHPHLGSPPLRRL